MALKWKKKAFWIDEDDGKFYIHPIIAFATIALTVLAVWEIFF